MNFCYRQPGTALGFFVKTLARWALLLLIAFQALGAPDFVPGRILVKPRPEVAATHVRKLLALQGAVEQASIPQIGVHIVRVPEDRHAQVLEALSHNPNIQFAEPDYLVEPALVPNDSLFSTEWHLTKIQAPQAWDVTIGNSSVTIAILDTGCDPTHPDLATKYVPGWNFYDNNADTSDVHGHGTSVAGVAAAINNNGLGVASVAWNCSLMPIRIADPTGWATGSAIANGLTFAADHGARVANISFAVSTSTTVTAAAQYFQGKGGVVAVAAGNNGTFYSDPDNIYMLTVSATDSNDALAAFSTTGNNIDLAAPGVSIPTTTRGGGYGSGSGISFSAPIVAGVAALVFSANPTLSATQVQDILKQTADDLGTLGWDPSYGYGRVNAYKAVLVATGGHRRADGHHHVARQWCDRLWQCECRNQRHGQRRSDQS